MVDLTAIGQQAKRASRALAGLDSSEKNTLLREISQALISHKTEILSANQKDVQRARENGISAAMIDRLTLTQQRIEAIASDVLHVAGLTDPVGSVDGGGVLENGLRMQKVRVPLGVVGIIYEARPNVTVDAATLCLKSGNACILRGGKEAIDSNKILISVMRGALEKLGYDANIIQLIEDTSRDSASAMMKMNGYIDVLIPRGGAGLIQSVVQNATLPVIETGTGNCHVYIDSSADLQMGVDIIVNAKTSRPSVCNACETLLVHHAIAESFLPLAAAALAEHHVELRGCAKTREILSDYPVRTATEEDYQTEFLDYILAVRVVDSLDEAIAHITKYSTMHSECIVTRDYESSQKFTSLVDAAAVYVNASTRFTDGGMFGLGAEIGISTQKLHARGPMGLRELTTIKYIVFGDGQIR